MSLQITKEYLEEYLSIVEKKRAMHTVLLYAADALWPIFCKYIGRTEVDGEDVTLLKAWSISKEEVEFRYVEEADGIVYSEVCSTMPLYVLIGPEDTSKFSTWKDLWDLETLQKQVRKQERLDFVRLFERHGKDFDLPPISYFRLTTEEQALRRTIQEQKGES